MGLVAMFRISLYESGVCPYFILKGIILAVINSWGIILFENISFMTEWKQYSIKSGAFFINKDDKRSNPGAFT